LGESCRWLSFSFFIFVTGSRKQAGLATEILRSVFF